MIQGKFPGPPEAEFGDGINNSDAELTSVASATRVGQPSQFVAGPLDACAVVFQTGTQEPLVNLRHGPRHPIFEGSRPGIKLRRA